VLSVSSPRRDGGWSDSKATRKVEEEASKKKKKKKEEASGNGYTIGKQSENYRPIELSS